VVRKTKEDALVTREKILDAAEDVFYDKGFSASTLQDIANVADVTRGAIYWHFNDKNDLFNAICERVLTPFERALSNPIDNGTSMVSSLKDICLSNFNEVAMSERKQKVLSIMLFKYEYISDGESICKRERDGKAKFVVYIASILKKAQNAGEIDKDYDCDMLAHCLHVFIMGLYKDFLVNINGATSKEHWVGLIKLFFSKMFGI